VQNILHLHRLLMRGLYFHRSTCLFAYGAVVFYYYYYFYTLIVTFNLFLTRGESIQVPISPGDEFVCVGVSVARRQGDHYTMDNRAEAMLEYPPGYLES
jgi:hypothetical protein